MSVRSPQFFFEPKSLYYLKDPRLKDKAFEGILEFVYSYIEEEENNYKFNILAGNTVSPVHILTYHYLKDLPPGVLRPLTERDLPLYMYLPHIQDGFRKRIQNAQVFH